VLPLTSPNLLKKTEVLRIERLHEEYPHLSGYFWNLEDELQMQATFEDAKVLLRAGGIPESHIATHFRVQSGEIANILIESAKSLGCSTLVLGRRGLSQVKEFFLGSVSRATTRLAKGLTVWIVDS
jgi:nucleotide-binding universal stress UspA family protein